MGEKQVELQIKLEWKREEGIYLALEMFVINKRRIPDNGAITLGKLINLNQDWSREALQGELSHPPTRHWWPQGQVFHQTSPAGGRKMSFSLPPATVQPIPDCHSVTPQPPKSHSIQTPGFLPLDSVYNSPSNSLLSCIRTFLYFVLQTRLWFCYSLYVPNRNSLLFLNKPIFAGKTTHFIFQVNNSETDFKIA